MREYVVILDRAPRLPAGMERGLHRLRPGEPAQFGDMILTLQADHDVESDRVQVRLEVLLDGRTHQCRIRRLAVPGIDRAILYPRAVRWTMATGRDPELIMEFHQPVRHAQVAS